MKLFLLPVFFFLTSCKQDSEPSYPSNVETQGLTQKTFSYLALGDSYTIGQSVTEENSFPSQLSNSLSTSTLKWKANPLTIVAQTGWTTDALINAINSRNITSKFDVVTLLIGVNNQYRGYPVQTYRQEFIQLLNKAIAYANGDKTKVFVLSIPDWGATPFADGMDRTQISKEIDQFNAINKEETLKAGVDYTDITPISRMAQDKRSLIANDGLHPSGEMYNLWVAQLTPKVLLQLTKQ